jgi:hypothetical protein
MSRLAGLAVLWALTACEAPTVFPGADKRQNTRAARIEGTVLVSSVARGEVVLFLFDAAQPPPPLGNGRPLTFTVVSRQAIFGDAPDGTVGPFTAPFTFSQVGAGQYLVRGFIDANADFIPWYGVTNEVNAGDVGGAAVDPVTGVSRVVEVTVDEAGQPRAVVDVSVSFSDTARVPVDRPAFALPSSVTLGATPTEVQLTVHPLSSELVQQHAPVFLARLVDVDGDGVPDDADGDGVADFWPRVVVRKLSDADGLLDENDLDENGVLDTEPGFADYEHVDPGSGATLVADGAPDLVVLAASFKVEALMPQLLDGAGKVKQTPTAMSTLSMLIKPIALDVSNPKAPQVLQSVPKGRYSVTIVQERSGQTWRVPNELAPEFAVSRGLPAVEAQAFTIEVP